MSREHKVPEGYEKKFANFITLCETTKANKIDFVIVATPWVLGDTYDELIESLSRLAEANLALRIVGPDVASPSAAFGNGERT